MTTANHIAEYNREVIKPISQQPEWVQSVGLALSYNSDELARYCLVGYLPWVVGVYEALKVNN